MEVDRHGTAPFYTAIKQSAKSHWIPGQMLQALAIWVIFAKCILLRKPCLGCLELEKGRKRKPRALFQGNLLLIKQI